MKRKRSMRTKKWILPTLIVLLFAGMVISISLFYHSPKKELYHGNENPAVFFSPHPDDETLNMGITVAKMVHQKRPVYIVLLTHGRESGALQLINKTLRTQYKYDLYGPLDRDQLETARMKEFYNAGEALGVPRDHLFVEYLDKGKPAITYPETLEVIKKYVNRFPTADFFSLSWMDIHYDHRMSGKALRSLYLDHTINHQTSRVYFFISMATRIYMENKKEQPPGVKDRATPYSVQKMVRNAMKAYNQWDPKKGSYAVGFSSVARQFKKLNHEMYHYVHGIEVDSSK